MMFAYESRMNYLGNIKHRERLISSKPINFEHFRGCLQHGKLLSTMFGGTFYCVRADLFIKAKKKKTDSIWENPVRKQSSLKVVVWNKLSLIVTTQATIKISDCTKLLNILAQQLDQCQTK
ncbi:Hypothetical_protein [Hexamita inflata]|uniref:Hypothetical_protein n=1 Tax=Hexamita inflata TaxID=28002 RepID=A0AA86UCM0_9EUKA|nr:Hypothetical protein HINF_LOCUS40350 [Hexamita inflata]